MNEESEFVAHEPCPNCGSSDANSVYSDGHKFCFSCNTYTPAEDWTHTHTRMNNDSKTTTARFLGEAEALRKRGISEATNNFYRIYRYGNTLRFPYYSPDGTVVGFKIKLNQKTSITKEDLQQRYLVNTYFLQAASELSSLKES